MIRLDDQSRTDEIYTLWQQCFQDPAEYAEFYFENVYGENQVLLNETDDKIRGMIHLNPYEMLASDQEMSSSYIVGVATDKDYRRQGVMRGLLTESFRRMRERGETFTYLMPADSAYYLPFDFRFGMNRVEQEVVVLDFQEIPEDEFTFVQEVSKEEMRNICEVENDANISRFSLATKITENYLDRLSKETAGDRGFLFYVYQDGRYAGRFEMAAENDCMVLSRIFCRKPEDGEAFLRGVIRYAENRYHYGSYELILDESWEGRCIFGRKDGIRYMPAKRKPAIMFRLLNLEKIAELISLDWDEKDEQEEQKSTSEKRRRPLELFVEDIWLPEQQGLYQITRKEGHLSISMTGKERGEADRITIADLTGILFGEISAKELEEYDTFQEETKKVLGAVRPLRKNCIMEIV